MIKLGADDDDEDERPIVETDPRSSNFMTVRIGNTYVDPWGGRKQMVVLQMRILRNSIKSASTGEIQNLGQTAYVPTREDLAIRMLKNKLAPSTGMLAKWMAKRTNAEGEDTDEFGNPYDLKQQIIDNAYPMYWSNVAELHKEQPLTVALALDFYGFWGEGVNTYAPKDKESIERRVNKILE